MDINSNLKYSIEIVNRYMNKYSTVRLCSDLKLRKLKPFKEVYSTCDFIDNDIREALDNNDLDLAYNRVIFLSSLVYGLLDKLNYKFSIESTKLSEFEERLLDDLICIPVRQVGSIYFKKTDNRRFIQEMDCLLRDTIRNHANKCRCSVDILKLECLNRIKFTLKFLLNTSKDCRSFVDLSTYKQNTLYLKDLISTFNVVSEETKSSCKRRDMLTSVTTLTDSDMCYVGAGDSVIRVKHAKDLIVGMQHDLSKNLGYLTLD